MKREDIFQKAENSDFDEILGFLLEFPCPGAPRAWEISTSRENSQFSHSEKYLHVSCCISKSYEPIFKILDAGEKYDTPL